MRNSKSINCNSCGGSIKMDSESYGKCEYCGNTNKVFSDGRTIIENERKPAPRLSGRNIAPIIIKYGIPVLVLVLLPIIMKKKF